MTGLPVQVAVTPVGSVVVDGAGADTAPSVAEAAVVAPDGPRRLVRVAGEDAAVALADG